MRVKQTKRRFPLAGKAGWARPDWCRPPGPPVSGASRAPDQMRESFPHTAVLVPARRIRSYSSLGTGWRSCHPGR